MYARTCIYIRTYTSRATYIHTMVMAIYMRAHACAYAWPYTVKPNYIPINYKLIS